MAVSLALAQLVESLGWTEGIARLAAPLVRFARFGPAAGASFALAFFSPAAANALLAENRAGGAMSRKELVAANLFNSAPAFLVHLPSLAALAFSFLGPAAVPYLGLVFSAAMMRTAAVALYGHIVLPRRPKTPLEPPRAERPSLISRDTLRKAGRRLLKRLKKTALFTIPVYCALFFLQHAGVFAGLETWMAGQAGVFRLVSPQAFSVVALYVAAENGAAFSAAAVLLGTGAVLPREAVVALLAGNILSSPVRAFRHQLPSYAGFFSPGPALMLVSANQILRAVSLTAVTLLYWFLTASNA
jgi:hypothetical protein